MSKSKTEKAGKSSSSRLTKNVDTPETATGGTTQIPDLGDAIQDLRQAIYGIVKDAVLTIKLDEKNIKDTTDSSGASPKRGLPYAEPNKPKPVETPDKYKLDFETKETKEAKGFKDHKDMKDDKSFTDTANKIQRDTGNESPTPRSANQAIESALEKFANSIAKFKK